MVADLKDPGEAHRGKAGITEVYNLAIYCSIGSPTSALTLFTVAETLTGDPELAVPFHHHLGYQAPPGRVVDLRVDDPRRVADDCDDQGRGGRPRLSLTAARQHHRDQPASIS